MGDIDGPRDEHGGDDERNRALDPHHQFGLLRVGHRIGGRERGGGGQGHIKVVGEARLPVARGESLLVLLLLGEDQVGVGPVAVGAGLGAAAVELPIDEGRRVTPSGPGLSTVVRTCGTLSFFGAARFANLPRRHASIQPAGEVDKPALRAP